MTSTGSKTGKESGPSATLFLVAVAIIILSIIALLVFKPSASGTTLLKKQSDTPATEKMK